MRQIATMKNLTATSLSKRYICFVDVQLDLLIKYEKLFKQREMLSISKVITRLTTKTLLLS